MNLLSVSRINKETEGEPVLIDVSFTQQHFQKIAIAGETGSGKSTLLKIIAGLVQPDSGVVLLQGERVKGPEEKLLPGHPRIAYLSQHFELRHHYRVEEVLQYANTLPEEEAQTLYEVCQISHLLKRKTDQLSGGEKQRIALCRLLITAPQLLLLDEPYSNLDMIHKNTLKSVIHDIGESLDITCILVSHDPQDTLSWADEIIVLKEGRIVQKGSPRQVYHQPVNEYTAGLFGTYNLLAPAEAEAFAGSTGVKNSGQAMLVRPEHFKLVAGGSRALMAQVRQVRFLGSYYEIEVLLSGKTITVRTTDCNCAKGETVYISLSSDDVRYVQ